MNFGREIRRVFSTFVCVVLGFFPLAAATTAASAAGVGDVTNAVRYANNGNVIGTVATEIEDSDDEAFLMEAPWPMNFFGRKYDGLCVTSNGTVSPVVYDNGNADCDDSYDETLADLAEAAEAPLIAAFSNDNDLGETVRGIEKTVTSFSVTGDPSTSDAVVTVTTSSAHGLTTGDIRSVYLVDSAIDNGNTDDNRLDYLWFEDVGVTVVDSTRFTFDGNTAENGDTSYAPQYPNAAKTGTVTVDSGWMWNDSGNDLNGIDDGTGKINTVYLGTTTIGGRDAWVYTNYRSVTNDGADPDIFTNTFQIVLIKRDTVNGSTRGFDFDIEYNFGSVKDGDDGYDDDSGDSCEYLNSHCRTGVGLVDWDPIGEVADVYELFGSTPSRDLVDGYPTSMTSNRLNSDINGRYTFRMVGGVVQNFSVPVMDGTGNTVDRPESDDPLAPVPEQQTQNAGDSLLTVDGVDTEIEINPNNSVNGIVGTSGGLVFELAGLDSGSQPLDLDSDGNLILNADGLLETGGAGFAANSPVKVYVYSDPTFLGMLFTDPTGAFSGTLQIPEGLDPGVHNIQVVGYDSSGNVLVFTVGVVINRSSGGTDGYGGDSLLAATGFGNAGALATIGAALAIIGALIVTRQHRAGTRI
jgi:hypothetical protein